jgi:hypothetical protein
MEQPSKFGEILRFIGIVLMGLTAVLILLGGIGTTCVALGAENYEAFSSIAPYKWLYQIFVVVTILVGMLAIRATVNLVRRKNNAYRDSVIALILGLVIGGIHMIASQALRGSSIPGNYIVYVNTFTLLVFLLFRIPGLWEQVDFNRLNGKTNGGSAAGAAMIVAGVLTLTIHLWVGPTHTMGGINYADVWHTQLTIAGWLLILVSSVLAGASLLEIKLPFLSTSNQRA